MKLVDLIEHIKNHDLEELVRKELPNIELDSVDTYMRDSLAIESEIKFFNPEEMPIYSSTEIDGIKYENLFPLAMLQEMIQDYLNLKKYSNLEIAERLLSYRIKDA